MSNDPITTEQIWGLLGTKLRSFLLGRVSDEQVADDLLQETFIRIHQKLTSIDDQERIRGWVYQIARNLVIDHHRAKSRVPAALVDDVAYDANDEGNLNEQVMGWMPAMIAQLPDAYREAVELYELKGVPQQQIADELGISLSGAKSRVQRGRAKLKTILFNCCSLERDRRGNVIGYVRNVEKDCNSCDDGADREKGKRI